MDEFAPFDVVCHTADCGNSEQSIQVLAIQPDPLVICGVCGQLITDVTPIGALS